MKLQSQSPKNPRKQSRGRFLARWTHRLNILPLVLCVAQVIAPVTAWAQGDSVDEYRLKAAMLYHLTQFVEWPSSVYSDSHAPILLCVLGQDPFANSLTSTFPRETGSGRPMLIRHLEADTEISGCQILYVSSSERRTVAHIFSTLVGSSILTVGEMTQFAARGGIIQFSLEDQSVHFNINIDAASRARLKISSKLLALAQIVRD
jgi:hypothetical protein